MASKQARVEHLTPDNIQRHPLERGCQAEHGFRRNPAVGEPKQRQVGGRKQGVSRIDRLSVAPDPPDRSAVTSVGATVLDIVKDQGEVVQQLDCGGQRRGALHPPTGGGTAEEREGRPQMFPLRRPPHRW